MMSLSSIPPLSLRVPSFVDYEIPGLRKPPQATTMAVGEEGGDGIVTYAGGEETKTPVQEPPQQVTTMAIGEEGSGEPQPPITTTLAIGEETGDGPPPQEITTLALGEETGGHPDPKEVTTQAIGEETGGRRPPEVTTMAIGEETGSIPKGPPQFTTLALGEEGGSRPEPPPVVTMAIGEDGGWPGVRRFKLDLPELPQMRPAGPPTAGRTTTTITGEEGGGSLPRSTFAPLPRFDPPVPPPQPLPPGPTVEDPTAIGLRFAKFHPGGLNFLA